MTGKTISQEDRKQIIKEILTDLHNGKSLEDARQKFKANFTGVASAEIAAAEAELLKEGMPLEELQRLCSVHAALFEGALEKPAVELNILDSSDQPGHPANTLRRENRAIETLCHQTIEALVARFEEGDDPQVSVELCSALTALSDIKRHYQRKENLFFPYMERHGISAPPKVMWGVDDEIRAALSQAISVVADSVADRRQSAAAVRAVIASIDEMISKEENIMLPLILEVLSQEEWEQIACESDDLGYCLINTPPAWRSTHVIDVADAQAVGASGVEAPTAISEADGALSQSGADIALPTGALRLSELIGIFNTLPVDITFVGKDDTVRYFSQGAERIFLRTKAIIGRRVVDCHPPASISVVKHLLSDFKAGRKSHEDFWIQQQGVFVYIRYFAVRDDAGAYLGTLEVTQNITEVQALTGEKRLMGQGA